MFCLHQLNEEEHDVIVHYWTSAEEPDVNYAGGLDIETVVIKGDEIVNQLSKMSSYEIESLQERITNIENDKYDPENQY